MRASHRTTARRSTQRRPLNSAHGPSRPTGSRRSTRIGHDEQRSYEIVCPSLFAQPATMTIRTAPLGATAAVCLLLLALVAAAAAPPLAAAAAANCTFDGFDFRCAAQWQQTLSRERAHLGTQTPAQRLAARRRGPCGRPTAPRCIRLQRTNILIRSPTCFSTLRSLCCCSLSLSFCCAALLRFVPLRHLPVAQHAVRR